MYTVVLFISFKAVNNTIGNISQQYNGTSISNIHDSTDEYQMLLRLKNDRFRKATCDFIHDNLRNTELLRQ